MNYQEKVKQAVDAQQKMEQIINDKNDYYINYIEGVSKLKCRKRAVDIFNTYIAAKTNLFISLGCQMKVSRTIHIAASKSLIMNSLDRYYQNIVGVYYTPNTSNRNSCDFIRHLEDFVYDHFSSKFFPKFKIEGSEIGEAEDVLEALDVATSHENVYNQSLYQTYVLQVPSISDKILKLTEGMRPMKALRKVLEYIHYPNMKEFEKFRDDISAILTNKDTYGTINVSIDPIDFLTLSNNNANWRSCMRLPTGSYCGAVTSMLNSPYTLVAYLDSTADKFKINGIEYPNKAWRVLLFYDIENHRWICNNKQYPYSSDSLTEESMKLLADTVEQYTNEQFGQIMTNTAYSDISDIVLDYYGVSPYSSEYNEDEDEEEYYEDDEGYIDRFYDELQNDEGEAFDYLNRNIGKYTVQIETYPYYNDMYTNLDYNGFKIMFNSYRSKHGEFVDVAGPESCLFCGEEAQDDELLPMYYATQYHIADYENHLGMCEYCNDYNKELSTIEVPVLTWGNGYTEMKEELREWLKSNKKDYSNKTIVSIIQDNMLITNNTHENYIVRRHLPIFRLNEYIFNKLGYLKCTDEEEPEMNVFTSYNFRTEYGEYKVGFVNDEKDEIDIVERVNYLTLTYLRAKLSKRYYESDATYYENKYNEQNGTPYRHQNGYIFFDLIVPDSLHDKLHSLEVVTNKEEKFKAMQSIQNLRSSSQRNNG